MWSCLRFQWQFSGSRIVFFALSLTMIIVIEQNIVFSTEVYECRHLRLHFQSSIYRLSHVSLLNTDGVVHGARKYFCSLDWKCTSTILMQVPSALAIIPLLYDFFSIHFIPECTVIWVVILLLLLFMLVVLVFSVFIKCWLDLFGWRVG